ncbi:endonuclease/exonuclease/phosphatase family protein [Kineococcus sp. T13]|uniref:endonuclease/exonuclease/phosphatase family protein n=1 Tax=Kineococcus vitellinus TaxID=2696565 RepID=UPI001412FC42|nr:endonuclease/exonuclease/phosphatase family protein [Kineococcus vitellinus]
MEGAERRPLRTISYNLHEGRATTELVDLAVAHDADALCLQECDTLRLPDTVGPLVLAGATQRNRLGLALYYRPDRLHAHGHEMRPLRRSMHDRVLSPAHERLLAVRFEDLASGGALLTLASIHTAPLSATNAMRRHQITEALGAIRSAAHGSSSLVVGDFNYPWFASSLARRLGEQGYELSHSDLPTYVRKRFRGHFDFAVSEGMHIESVTTLQQAGSDHLPVLVQAQVNAAVPA